MLHRIFLLQVSLMSRIVPSPDWFIGIDSFDLCVNGNWLDSITIEVGPCRRSPDATAPRRQRLYATGTGLYDRASRRSFTLITCCDAHRRCPIDTRCSRDVAAGRLTARFVFESYDQNFALFNLKSRLAILFKNMYILNN